MLTDPQIAVAVAVVAAITFACRIAPFALLRGRRNSPLLGFLSAAMPLGVMIVLVAYTLDGVSTDPATWAPAAAGIASTAALHLETCALAEIGDAAARPGVGLRRSGSGARPAPQPRAREATT